MADYVNSLREGILEAYTGIVQGLKADGKSALLAPYIEGIFKFLHNISMDENRTDGVARGAIGLLGYFFGRWSASSTDLVCVSSIMCAPLVILPTRWDPK